MRERVVNNDYNEEEIDAPIIYGAYTDEEAHKMLMRINRIKGMQMSLIRILEDTDAWAVKKILDDAWYAAEDCKRATMAGKAASAFERRFLEELLQGAEDEDE